MIDSLQDSIVVITGKDLNNFGTGFLFYKDHHSTYLLTCTHVIKDVGGEKGLKANGHPAAVIASDTEDGFDLTVLKVEEILDKPILKLKSVAENAHSALAVGCYSYGKQTIIQDLECHLDKPGYVVSENLKNRTTCWHLEIQGEYHLEKGYSGAPLIDKATNKVLGIINQRKGKGEKGLAISIEALAKVWTNLPNEIRINLMMGESKIPITPEAGPLMNLEKEIAIFESIVTGKDTRSRLIAIHGPSLMGKSRLLREYRLLAIENNFEELLIDLRQQIEIDQCLDLIINKFEIQAFDEYYKYLVNKEPEPLTREQEREWHKNLTRIFYKNLKSCQDLKRLFVFFDQYEKADRDFKNWLNSTFIPHNFAPTPMILVIAGQEEISIDPSWPGQHRFNLKGVGKDCYVRYAENIKAPISKHEIELIHEACQGNPAYFAIYVQSKLRTLERIQ